AAPRGQIDVRRQEVQPAARSKGRLPGRLDVAPPRDNEAHVAVRHRAGPGAHEIERRVGRAGRGDAERNGPAGKVEVEAGRIAVPVRAGQYRLEAGRSLGGYPRSGSWPGEEEVDEAAPGSLEDDASIRADPRPAQVGQRAGYTGAPALL